MPDLAQQIELYLLDQGTWIPTRDICTRFDIPERLLRQDGRRPGLLDHCAVSSTCGGQSGYIHHRFLPTDQWLKIKHRLRRHAIGEMRRVRRWDRSRHNILTGPRDGLSEAHTGQLLLPVLLHRQGKQTPSG